MSADGERRTIDHGHGGDPGGDGRSPGVVSRWRRTYGASPLHLLLHLAAIALIAYALSQSFDDRYSAAYGNLALWMVGGALLNDLVAIPLYVGIDRAARAVWGRVRGTAAHPAREHPHHAALSAGAERFDAGRGATTGHERAADHRERPVRTPLVGGQGHVRVPVAMSAVLLLVYFPNITHKAPIGHRLSTGLAEQPDYAARWLGITAGLLVASAVLYGVRVLLARRRRGRTGPSAA